jgi:hypothetical protein
MHTQSWKIQRENKVRAMMVVTASWSNRKNKVAMHNVEEDHSIHHVDNHLFAMSAVDMNFRVCYTVCMSYQRNKMFRWTMYPM